MKSNVPVAGLLLKSSLVPTAELDIAHLTKLIMHDLKPGTINFTASSSGIVCLDKLRMHRATTSTILWRPRPTLFNNEKGRTCTSFVYSLSLCVHSGSRSVLYAYSRISRVSEKVLLSSRIQLCTTVFRPIALIGFVSCNGPHFQTSRSWRSGLHNSLFKISSFFYRVGV